MASGRPSLERKRRLRLQRARQARYQARRDAGVLVCAITLDPNMLDTLVRLHWLHDNGAISAQQAAAAIERLLQQL